MTLFPSTNLEITVHTNIAFVGNANGTTVFDYGGKPGCATVININNNTKGKIIKFENITFEHYDPINHLPAFQINAAHDQFQILFYHCTFRNNDYQMVALDAFCNTKSQTKPQILFQQCNFYNNSDTIVRTNHSFTNQKNEELYKSLTVHFLNSNFIDNKGLFYLHYSGLILENCYFSKIDTNLNNDKKFALYYSESQQLLSIKNSTFENINIKNTHPLIESLKLNWIHEFNSFPVIISNVLDLEKSMIFVKLFSSVSKEEVLTII